MDDAPRGADGRGGKKDIVAIGDGLSRRRSIFSHDFSPFSGRARINQRPAAFSVAVYRLILHRQEAVWSLTSAILRLIATERIGYRIRRNRARTNRIHQILVLCCLRRGKLQAENLLVLRRNLFVLRLDALCRQCVNHRAGVSVCVVQNVANAALNGVASVASLSGKVVVHALDCRLRLAAAIRRLGLHRVKLLHERGLLIGAGKFRLSEAVCHLHLYAVCELRLCVESVTQAAVHVVDFSLDIGEVGGENVTVHDRTLSAVAIAKATPSVIAPSAENEEEKDDNPVCAIATEEAVAVLVAVSAGKQSHVRRGEFRSHAHCFSPFRIFEVYAKLLRNKYSQS